MEEREMCYSCFILDTTRDPLKHYHLNTLLKSFVLSFSPYVLKNIYHNIGTVNSTSDYTLWTLHRSYLKGISANIELLVYCVTCCRHYIWLPWLIIAQKPEGSHRRHRERGSVSVLPKRRIGYHSLKADLGRADFLCTVKSALRYTLAVPY
jgi:hypothetical protein